MVNGVRLVFVGSFISDQLSFWVNFPFNADFYNEVSYSSKNKCTRTKNLRTLRPNFSVKHHLNKPSPVWILNKFLITY